MKRFKLILLAALPMILALAVPAGAQTELRKSAVSSGGAMIGNGSYRLICTVGQGCVGITSSAQHRHIIGFLAEGGAPVSGAEDIILPTRAFLAQNFPNPFSPLTTIRFDLPDSRHVSLDIFSLDGRRVVSLIDRTLPPGRLNVVWDGRDSGGHPVASGMYLYRVSAGDYTKTRRMVLTR